MPQMSPMSWTLIFSLLLFLLTMNLATMPKMHKNPSMPSILLQSKKTLKW